MRMPKYYQDKDTYFDIVLELEMSDLGEGLTETLMENLAGGLLYISPVPCIHSIGTYLLSMY